MPDIKEKPKMGSPKIKHQTMLAPKQAARLMKERYVQQLDQRPAGEDTPAEYAPGSVERAGRWAVDEVTVNHPRRSAGAQYRERQRPPAAANQPNTEPRDTERPWRERPANSHKERPTVWSGDGTAAPVQQRRTRPQVTPGSTPSPTSEFHPPESGTPTVQALGQSPQVRQARRQFVLNNRRRGLTVSPRPSVDIPDKPDRRGSAAPVGRRGALLKERPRSYTTRRDAVQTMSAKASPGPKVRGTPTGGSVRPTVSLPQQRMTQRAVTQAQKAAKKTTTVFHRGLKAVGKAAAALANTAVGIVGGGVILAVLTVIIVIAAVSSSPFGLFFAGEPTAPGTVSAAQGVAQVNMAYNTKLETLQTGDYDNIDIQGQPPDWPDVLAVFAVKVAGADGGMDVATLDADRIDKLTAVFWDMTCISTKVETISHAGDDESEGWTEKILHITITPKTTDDMRTAYGFTTYQNSALDELLADRAALETLIGNLAITDADARDVLSALPEDLSPERREVVQTALKLYGKVSYFWGGKSLILGWDNRWGTTMKVTAAGSPTTGTYRPYGLDCSGFVDWVFYNATDGDYIIGHGGGAHAQHTYCTNITWEDAQTGDLVFYPKDTHVGIICGSDANGNLLAIHCASGTNNVVITGVSGFTSVARPNVYHG